MSDFIERLEHEHALGKMGVGNGESGTANEDVMVDEDVDVDEAVVIDTTFAFFGASQVAFNGLCGIEQFVGQECGLNANADIQKTVFGMESPRLSDEKSGLGHNCPNPLLYFGDGKAKIFFLIAKIRAK